MNRIFSYTLTAALVGGLSLSVTSCKSDEDVAVETITPSTLTVDNDIITHGIETDMQNSVVEMPVKCDGEWVAILSIDDDEDDMSHSWVKIQDWKVIYKGDQTLRLQFDDNMTGADRSTTLTLANNIGKILAEVPVRQTYTWKGQAPTNSSAQSFQNKGIGYGIDYNYLLNLKSIRYRSSAEDASATIQNAQAAGEEVRFNPLKCKKTDNIYHLTYIDQLCKAGAMGKDKDAYVEEPIEIANLQAAMVDSAMSKDKKLSIGLKIDGSVGPVSFGIEGRYVDKRMENRNYVDYTIIRNAPMYDVMTAPGSITTYADRNKSVDFEATANFIKNVQDIRRNHILANLGIYGKNIGKLGPDSLETWQKKIIDGMYRKMMTTFSFGGVFSSTFETCYSKLYNHITLRLAGGMQVASDKADRVCQDLDDHYGPFIIAAGQFGGSMVIHLQIDTLRLNGEVKVNGKASVDVSGVIEGEADATYREKGFQRLRHYHPDIKIYGGDSKNTENVLMAIAWSPNPDDHEQWTDMLQSWMQSLTSSAEEGNLSMAAPISFTAVPIWTYFADTDIAAYVRSYFMNKYKTRKIAEYLDIIDDVPDHKTFIEILNETRENEPDAKEPEIDPKGEDEDDDWY